MREKITELNKELSLEKCKACSINPTKIKRLIYERDQLISDRAIQIDQLMSDRNEVEKLLSETDHNRKEDTIQVQSQIKSIKVLLIVLSILVFLGLAVAFGLLF